jgi:hypothetical protein
MKVKCVLEDNDDMLYGAPGERQGERRQTCGRDGPYLGVLLAKAGVVAIGLNQGHRGRVYPPPPVSVGVDDHRR